MSQDMGGTVYPCPCDLIHGSSDCGRVFATENGAVMHGINKSDGYHDVLESKPEAYRALASDAALDPPAGDGGESESESESESGPGSESRPEVDPEDKTPAVADGSGGLTAVMPEADGDGQESDGQESDPAADCPACGSSLGMTEADALAFVRENGGAWCEDCGAKLVDESGGSA